MPRAPGTRHADGPKRVARSIQMHEKDLGPVTWISGHPGPIRARRALGCFGLALHGAYRTFRGTQAAFEA